MRGTRLGKKHSGKDRNISTLFRTPETFMSRYIILSCFYEPRWWFLSEIKVLEQIHWYKENLWLRNHRYRYFTEKLERETVVSATL